MAASPGGALGVLSEADTERLGREIPPVDCLVSSGGIVAMRPLILHASSKAETDHTRRVLHIEYADSLEKPILTRIQTLEDLHLLRHTASRRGARDARRAARRDRLPPDSIPAGSPAAAGSRRRVARRQSPGESPALWPLS
jgi:hypothetical protein